MRPHKFLPFACAVAALVAVGCTHYEYPFQNPKLKVEKRVDDLLSRLTPEEKIGNCPPR